MSTRTVASGWSLSTLFFLPGILFTTSFPIRPASSDFIVSPPLTFSSDLKVSSRSWTPWGSISPMENVRNSNLSTWETIFPVIAPKSPDSPLHMKQSSSVRVSPIPPTPCLSLQNLQSRNSGGFSSTRGLTSGSPQELPHLPAFARLHHGLRLPVSGDQLPHVLLGPA